MNLEEFRQLDPEAQRQTLAEMRARVNQVIIEAAQADLLEATLVPSIPIRKAADLPPIRNRDEVVRELMKSDSSIREVVTQDGVKYLR